MVLLGRRRRARRAPGDCAAPVGDRREARERFDVLHVHEPMTPVPGVAALALTRSPLVATFHAAGELSWLKLGKPLWGFLLDRLDHRIAVSAAARDAVARYFPGDYELIP